MGTGNGIYDLIKTAVNTRTRIGHNTHEDYGRLQYGGKAMEIFDLISSQGVDSRSDDSVLGR